MNKSDLIAAIYCGLVASLASACSDEGGAAKDGRTDAVSQPEAGTSGDAGTCNGRGSDLDGLAVNDDAGLELDVIDHDPSPPIVGDNTLWIRLSFEGEPLADAAGAITVSPRMPDHGHGTPVKVVVSEVEDGEYELSPLNTFMPGYWQIEVRVESEAVTSRVEFGICIE